MYQILILVASFVLHMSEGHVALMEPPARNVLWRAGYPELPKHEDDDYLICTEEGSHYCPPCGDNSDSAKPYAHQAGGQWALGIIARNYSAGETISVSASVTNSHGGFMEFKLCPNNDVSKPVTQRCLDQYPLEVVGYPDNRVPISAPYQGKEEIQVSIRLPKNLQCDQCVMQMSQYAEQFKPSNVMFRNCADIAITRPSRSSSYASDESRGSSSSRHRSNKGNKRNFGSSNSRSSGQREISFPGSQSKYNSREFPPRQNGGGSFEGGNRYFGQQQSGQKYTEAFHQDFLYGQSGSAPLIRNQRQPSQEFYSSEIARPQKNKRQQVISFPGQSDPKYSAATGAQFSGANKEKFQRQSGAKSGNKALSGFPPSSGSGSSYQYRSKSMFPLYQPSIFTAFGSSSKYFL